MHLLNGLSGKIKSRVRPLSVRRKIALFVVMTLALYGAMIILDNEFLIEEFSERSHPDLDVYRDRTQTILDGGLLYRDVHTETPPLINYILVPAQLLGGAEHDWVWSAYFSFFAFLLASMMYLGLRHQDEWNAFLAGAFVLLSPFTIVESGTGEDESVMVFVFMASVLFMTLNYRNRATMAIGAGIWTKMFPILLLPVHMLRQSRWKDRLSMALMIVVVTALIALPFVLLCWGDFSSFLNFYFLGDGSRPTGGHSIWHFLRMGGWEVPTIIQIVILGLALTFAYLYPHHQKWPVWESITLVALAFFIFYPKIHGGYWIMLVALLSVWAVEDRRVLLRLTAAFVPMIGATLLAAGETSPPTVEFYGSWFIGFLLALIGLLLFVDAARIALKGRPFVSTDPTASPEDQSSCLPASVPERQS